MSTTHESELPAGEPTTKPTAEPTTQASTVTPTSALHRLRRYINCGGRAQRRLELGLVVFVSGVVVAIASGFCRPTPRMAPVSDALASDPELPPSCDAPEAMSRFEQWIEAYEQRGGPRESRQSLAVHTACARKQADGPSHTTALHSAAIAGRTHAVRWLLSAAPVRKRDLDSAVFDADAHPEVVALLRTKGAVAPELSRAAARIAPNAMLAALEGHDHEPEALSRALNLLLDRGASCNGCDAQAYARQQVRVVGLLLKKGARIDGQGLAGLCARGDDMTDSHLSLALRKREPGAIEHALGRMTPAVPESVVRRVAAQGVDWGWRDGEDDAPMPLVRAVESRNEELVRVLVDLGAPVDRVYKDGSSALQAAVTCSEGETGCGRITEFLLAHGAEANRRFPDGTTPLFAAAEAGNGRVVRALIDDGARLETRVLRETALNAAERSGHTLAARILAARGARMSTHD